MLLLAFVEIAVFFGIAAACCFPRIRRGLAVALLVVGVAALLQALLAGSTPRALDVTTTFTAYEGLNVARKDFLVDQVTAPAWAWGLLSGFFALAWGAWAWAWRSRATPHANGAPLALAWSGCALILLLEKAAAPHGLTHPFDLGPDKALFPATLAAAILLARQRDRVLEMVLGLALFLGTTRIALGCFATLATQYAWGTHLDVHAIDFIAFGTQPVELVPGSLSQWWWLIAVPHLVVFPAIYMMSIGGIAFGLMMVRKQRRVDQARAAAVVVLAALFLSPASAQDPQSRPATRPTTAPTIWTTDHARALKQAQAEGKDLLLGFVGYDWCNWCQRLRQEVFEKEAFRQKAPQAFVLVEIDRPRHRPQDPAVTKQNRELREKFGIHAFPTIYLADARGRPYARTGYREVGPEIYLGHLLELREIRKKRDDEFQKAASARGRERARYLAAGLDALPRGIPLDDYLPLIDEIVALDPDDEESLKTRFTEVKRRVLKERAMRELTRRLDALAGKKNWAEIRAAVARFKKEQKPTGAMLQELVWVEAVTWFEQDRKQQARAKFQEVTKLDPNSDLGRQAQKAIRCLGN